MTRTLAQEVLAVLDQPHRGTEPVTLAYLARRFGVSGALMTSCARQLVASGEAEPSMGTSRGMPALQGLLPHQQPAPTEVESEVAPA